MKKTWMMFFVLAIAALPAAAANITVNTPAAGAALEIGKSLPITWTFAGLPASTKVSIFLCQGNSKLGNIVQNLAIGSAGQGAFDWSAGAYIGGTATAGNDFFIKIRTNDGAVTGKSGLFTLAAKPGNTADPVALPAPVRTIPKLGQTPPPCMAITSPKAGQIADPFNIVNIIWSRYGNLDPNVSITLKRPGKGAHLPGVTLAASFPNSGIFSWDLSGMMPAPGAYFVQVRTLDGKCQAASEEFTINEIGSIELLSPLGGEVWENGTSHAVTWKRTGNIRKVDILLNRASSTYKTLATGVDAKLGTATCVFEKASGEQGNPCHYNLFLKKSPDGGGSNVSGCITLTGNPDLAITNVGYSGLFNVGYDMTFSVKVENMGAVASQACQGDLKVNGVTSKTFPIPAIPPGQSVNLPVTWKVACPGALKITIDANGANIEADKANNVWEKNIC